MIFVIRICISVLIIYISHPRYKEIYIVQRCARLVPSNVITDQIELDVFRDGVIFFPEFCKVILRKFREDNVEVFGPYMFKVAKYFEMEVSTCLIGESAKSSRKWLLLQDTSPFMFLRTQPKVPLWQFQTMCGSERYENFAKTPM